MAKVKWCLTDNWNCLQQYVWGALLVLSRYTDAFKNKTKNKQNKTKKKTTVGWTNSLQTLLNVPYDSLKEQRPICL